MKKKRTSIKPLVAAVGAAIFLTAASARAEITETNAYRIKPEYPEGSTMTNWLANEAEFFALNPVNVRAGKHPDRSDPMGGLYDVLYIFPDATSANDWWDPIADPNGMPPTIPDTAVAFIHWELDNGSGSFPGVMSKSDVDGFKSRNCIMAAGEVIPLPGAFEVEKTCSNPSGSSKRFKMNVLIPNVPIDLVYNVEPQPLTYVNYDTLPTFDGITESGRIYRVLQKWHNATAMDSATQAREGVRLAGYRLELGHGVGADFSAIQGSTTDGLAADKTLGFELRPCMPDHFFDVRRDRPGTGTNPCSDSFDSLNQPLPQEIWLEEEYATFAPKMYSFIDDKRMLALDIPGGFWDKRPSGLYPPEIQTLGKLDSGYQSSDSGVYWDGRLDGSTPLPGYFGATAPNYFDIVNRQARDVGATTADSIPQPNPFGYLMYYGVLADGDTGILSQGVYRDDDGDPATEGDLVVWWDGMMYRWSIDGPVFDGVVTPEDAFVPVDPDLLKEWALHPLQEEPDFERYPLIGFPPGPLYEIGVMDDLGGLNIDYFVYLGRQFGALEKTNFTIRMTTVSVDNPDPYGDGSIADGFPIEIGEYGNSVPAWVSNPAPSLSTFIDADGVIDIRATAAGEPLQITLGDTNVSDSSRLTVSVENLSSGELEYVILELDAGPALALDWRYSGTLPTKQDVIVGDDNNGFLNVTVGDAVRVTYIDEFIGGDPTDLANFDVVKTDEVVIEVGSASGNVDIEKLTNGHQADGADDADVPRIDAGDAVSWTYTVTNTGTVAFAAFEILVRDSQAGVSPQLDVDSDDGDFILSPAESWTYTASAAALDLGSVPPSVILVPGCNDGRNTYQNTGQVNILGTTLFDQDTSHYCNPGDADADGVTDSLDNCFLEPNGPLIPDAGGNVQRDTDGDNYGNVCDPDFNQDLIINDADLDYLKGLFFSDDPDADLNGDGVVNAADLAITKRLFFAPPGPSGLAP